MFSTSILLSNLPSIMIYSIESRALLSHFAGVVNGIACYQLSGWALPACVRIAQVTLFCMVFKPSWSSYGPLQTLSEAEFLSYAYVLISLSAAVLICCCSYHPIRF